MFHILVVVFLPIALGMSIETFGIREDFKEASFAETSEESKYNVSLL